MTHFSALLDLLVFLGAPVAAIGGIVAAWWVARMRQVDATRAEQQQAWTQFHVWADASPPKAAGAASRGEHVG